jgi:hypothetical protein
LGSVNELVLTFHWTSTAIHAGVEVDLRPRERVQLARSHGRKARHFQPCCKRRRCESSGVVDQCPHLMLWRRLAMPIAMALPQTERRERVALDQAAALRGRCIVEHRPQ